MNRIKKFIFIFLAAALSSCMPAEPLQPPTPSTTDTSMPSPQATHAPPSATPGQTSDRAAVLTLIENDVRARLMEQSDFEPASLGQEIQTGGQASSGDQSKARLDIVPDGTIVRLGPNSIFTMLEMAGDTSDPFSRLKLFLGELWIILGGGSLEVETPLGTAAVRGSFLSVAYDPGLAVMRITCLEGACSLENDLGAVILTSGQASFIMGSVPPQGPVPMSQAEMEAWIQASPEAKIWIETGEYHYTLPEGFDLGGYFEAGLEILEITPTSLPTSLPTSIPTWLPTGIPTLPWP